MYSFPSACGIICETPSRAWGARGDDVGMCLVCMRNVITTSVKRGSNSDESLKYEDVGRAWEVGILRRASLAAEALR